MTIEQDIKILGEIEHCLKRSGMYIGSTKPEKQFWFVPNEHGKIEKKEFDVIPGLYKIFNEVLDNSIDEVGTRGFGSEISIIVDKDNNIYSIEDDGRGIPLEKHKQAGIPTPQVVFTSLRSGSNFNDDDRMTSGMNGVGATLTTIFSEKLIVKIKRDGKIYQQSYTNNLSKISDPDISKDSKQTKTGTIVKFKPDPKIFSIPIPEELIHKRCMDLSYMFPKITFKLKIVSNNEDCFGCNKEFIYKTNGFDALIKMFDGQYSIYEDNKAGLKIAIVENKITDTFEHYSNVNGIDTYRGGTHVDGLKDIFCEDLKEKIKKELKCDITNGDVAKRMIVVIFQKLNAPTFEGQTKEKLVTDKVVIKKLFDEHFSQRKITSMVSELDNLKNTIIDDITLKNEKKDLKDLKDKQKTIDKKKVAKLIECSARDRSKCSIYITEGDSAISNLAMVRDSKTMAGLPLRGKVMNVYESTAKEVVENKEIQSIMASLGLKIGDNPIQFRLDKLEKSDLNYGKIIIATDQDMDGYCIRCLLINFIFKFWPDVIKAGLVYILETPLYECIDKKTNNAHYFYNKQEYENFISDKNTSKYEISYFKGLGSCGKEAWNYMINTNPNLVQIKLNDAKETSDKLKMVFGNDSDVRKKWLAS
jgi:DNA gyrase/topoisomerase IV subunit B